MEKANNTVMDIPHTYATAYQLGVIQDTPPDTLLAHKGVLADFSDGPWTAFAELCRTMQSAFPGSQGADQLGAIPCARHRVRELSSALRSLLHAQLQTRVAALRKMQAQLRARQQPNAVSNASAAGDLAALFIPSDGSSEGGSSEDEGGGRAPPASTPRLIRRAPNRHLLAPNNTPSGQPPPPPPLRSALRGSRDTPQPPSAAPGGGGTPSSPAHSRGVSVDTAGALLRAASDAERAEGGGTPATPQRPGADTHLGPLAVRSSPRRDGTEGGSPHRRVVSMDSSWAGAAGGGAAGGSSPPAADGTPAAPWLGRTPLHLRLQGSVPAAVPAKLAPVPAHLRAGVCGKAGVPALYERKGGAGGLLRSIIAQEESAHQRLLAVTAALRSACDGVVRVCGGGEGGGAAGRGQRGRQSSAAGGMQQPPLADAADTLSDDAEACLLLTRLITRVRRDAVAVAAACRSQATRLAQAQHQLLACWNGDLVLHPPSANGYAPGAEQFLSRESYDLGSGEGSGLGPLPEGVQGGYGRQVRAATAGDFMDGTFHSGRGLGMAGAARQAPERWDGRFSRATSNPSRPRWRGEGAPVHGQ